MLELLKKSAMEQSKALKNKEVSAVELTKASLARIHSIDDKLGAFNSLTEEIALDTAKKVDEKISKGEELPLLAGVPLALKDNMNLILELLNIGKKTIRIVKQNLFWALFYNICMIPLAMGILPISLNPMIASLAMTFSSLTVVLNSLRLGTCQIVSK